MRSTPSVAEDTLDYVAARSDGAGRRVLSRRRTRTPRCRKNRECRVPSAQCPRRSARARSTSGRPPRSIGCSATMPPIVRRRFGIEDSGNALSDPQGEFRRPEHPVRRAVDRGRRRPDGTGDRRRDERARARETDALRRACDAAASAPRRQGHHRVERPDDCRVRARRARARRQSAAGRLAARGRARGRSPCERTSGDRSERRLLRRFRDGEAAIDGFCEDYACLTWGVLELFQATGDGAWLDWALDLTDAADACCSSTSATAAGSARRARTRRCCCG